MLKKRLFQIAFLSSPIIGIYGVLPIFLLNKVDFLFAISSSFGLSLIFFIFWVVNIYLVEVVNDSKTKRYFLSFVVTFLFHSFILLLAKPGEQHINIGYPIVYIIAINSIILIVIDYVKLQQDKEISDLAFKDLKVKNLEAQKQVLMQQLQPHFLFNALSTLKSLIQENPQEAEDYTVRLSAFLRYTVQSQTVELVTLQEEMKFTQDYLKLQMKRFNTALSCEVEIPENLLRRRIPVFAVQTLVENALKHNRFTDDEPLTIKVNAEAEQLTVWNNKQLKTSLATSGIGLLNLNARYELMAGKPVQIEESLQAFCVSIPLI